jgi:hypothetical protein
MLPKIIGAVVIFGAGWLAALWAAGAIKRDLSNDHVPGAAPIAYFARVFLIISFSSIAIFELDMAREIVIIGFASASITLGAIAVILTFIFGREWVGRIRPAQEKKQEPGAAEVEGKKQQNQTTPDS